MKPMRVLHYSCRLEACRELCASYVLVPRILLNNMVTLQPSPLFKEDMAVVLLLVDNDEREAFDCLVCSSVPTDSPCCDEVSYSDTVAHESGPVGRLGVFHLISFVCYQ